MNRRWALVLLVTLFAPLILGSGCTPEASKPAQQNGRPISPVQLTLLVVGDPGMAAEIGKLKADWKARTGVTFSVSEMTEAELLSGERATSETLSSLVDAVIYPSRNLGLLAERGWIAPLPADYATNRELDWRDTFELVQLIETHWGKAPYAVPFGSPVLTCYVRSDLLAVAHKRAPRNWSEYQGLAQFLSERENLGDKAPPADAPWYGTVEPLAKGIGGLTLLARAAPYAKHRDHYSALFKVDTMEPLIAGPAFVRALEELVASAKLGPANKLELDAAGVRAEFLAGHAAMCLSWPSAVRGGDGKPTAESTPRGVAPLEFEFMELPGSRKAYDYAAKLWDERVMDEPQQIPLLGVAGRLGSVAATTKNSAEAFQLLAWLTGSEWGTKVSAASPATTLFRPSQVSSVAAWLDPGTNPQAGQSYVLSLRNALDATAYVAAPRLVAQEKYLAALDRAVAAAVSGAQTPQQALDEVAAEWAKITAEVGLDAQRAAYRKSLNLEP